MLDSESRRSKESDDPESRIICTLFSPTFPEIITASVLTVATITVGVSTGLTQDWDDCCPMPRIITLWQRTVSLHVSRSPAIKTTLAILHSASCGAFPLHMIQSTTIVTPYCWPHWWLPWSCRQHSHLFS